MNPTSEEIGYATEQISEANRRLKGIYERVGEKGYSFTKKEQEGVFLESTVFSDDEVDPQEYLDRRGWDEPNVEIEEITEVNDEMVGDHVQNVIIDCQLCIELAAKSMFKLTGKNHPFSHGISFDDGRTQGFYNEIPDEFDRKEDISRVIFLTQFWGEFYELAKYGAPQLNMRPEIIFTINDGSRAVNDAEYCIEVAEDLLLFVEE